MGLLKAECCDGLNYMAVGRSKASVIFRPMVTKEHHMMTSMNLNRIEFTKKEREYLIFMFGFNNKLQIDDECSNIYHLMFNAV